ncbi:hypothetical protein PTKIN_Ptkin08bG0118300 [Pterospermum kingtungense]
MPGVFMIISMGPDLEPKDMSKTMMEVVSSDDKNVSLPHDSKDEFMHCASNSEDHNFGEETMFGVEQASIPKGNEDMEINITECTNSGGDRLADAECQDATENSSSFDGTESAGENDSVISDAEVESASCVGSLLGSVFDGLFEMRKRKLTDHWRRFIRPLMWRCKWLELQLKEFKSLTLTYDREVAEYDQKKMFEYEKFTFEGLNVKSQPFPCQIQRKKIMKRKKRKRVEDNTDLASYMSHHNLFSYYETKKSVVATAALGDDNGHLGTKSVNSNDDFGFNDELSGLEFRDSDAWSEQILRKIDLVQSRACKLKTRVDKVVNENPQKFSSINMLSSLVPFGALTFSSHGEVMPFPDLIESRGQHLAGNSYKNWLWLRFHMELIKQISQELTQEFMTTANHLEGEEKHKACLQLMFLSDVEVEFCLLKLENEKLKGQNKKRYYSLKLKNYNKRERIGKSRDYSWMSKSSLYRFRSLTKGKPSSEEVVEIKNMIAKLDGVHSEIKGGHTSTACGQAPLRLADNQGSCSKSQFYIQNHPIRRSSVAQRGCPSPSVLNDESMGSSSLQHVNDTDYQPEDQSSVIVEDNINSPWVYTKDENNLYGSSNENIEAETDGLIEKSGMEQKQASNMVASFNVNNSQGTTALRDRMDSRGTQAYKKRTHLQPTEDDILIHNQAAKEELHSFRSGLTQQAKESLIPIEKPKTVSTVVAPEDDLSTNPSVQPIVKLSPTSKSKGPNNKRKRGKRKSGSGRWSRRSSG